MTSAQLPTPPLSYVDWSAERKQSWLWDTVVQATEYQPVDLPDLSLPPVSEIPARATVVLSTTELSKTLDHSGDLMPPGRPKIIHEFGSTACVTMTIGPRSPYTGLLGPGEKSLGMARMSLAAPPGLRKSFIPGVGFKFLANGQPSLDIVAVNHTNGQGRNHNMFANPMSHDITDGHSELRLPQQIMAALFRRVTSETRRLRIDHLAALTPSGETVDSPISPRRLVFRPRVEAARLFRQHPGEDFRLTLGRLSPDAGLYDVMAESDDNSEATPIGSIACTSRFVASHGGDNLFFRHMIDSNHAGRPNQ